MPRFDPNQYEPVEERLARAVADHPDLRVITDCVIPGVDGKWLFRATIYLTDGDQAADLPKATGWASETDGGPQADFKAELGETSSIGRCLANFGYTGNRNSKTSRMTREEAQKASKTQPLRDDHAPETSWVDQATKMKTLEALRKLYAKAKINGASDDDLKQIRTLADEFSAGGKQAGAD